VCVCVCVCVCECVCVCVVGGWMLSEREILAESKNEIQFHTLMN